MQMGVPKIPHFHVLFENAPAVISGNDSAYRVRLLLHRDGKLEIESIKCNSHHAWEMPVPGMSGE